MCTIIQLGVQTFIGYIWKKDISFSIDFNDTLILDKMNVIKIIVPLLLIFLCRTDGILAQETPLTIKVLSYNIHYGVGMDGKKDLERIAGVINTINPDIVGLQEVKDSTMMATLGQLTNMNNVFGASTEKETPNLYRLLDIPVPASQLHYGMVYYPNIPLIMWAIFPFQAQVAADMRRCALMWIYPRNQVKRA